MSILLSCEPESTTAAMGLTPDRVRRAAAIYLRIKTELLKFHGVTEQFAREHAEHARDAFIRQCVLGRIN
jgi:hypothetical protein